MAIGLLASVGIGIVSSIFSSAASSAPSKGTSVADSAARETPSSMVKFSETLAALQKNTETAKTDDSGSLVDQLFAESPDSVKKAWEKTKEELGLDAGNKDFYMNQLAMMALMTQSGLTGGNTTNPSNFFGESTASAIDAVDAVIERLNASVPGYEQSSRDKQAALEMFGTFRQNLVSTASA